MYNTPRHLFTSHPNSRPTTNTLTFERVTQSPRDSHAMQLRAEITFFAIYDPKHTATEPNLLRVIQSQPLVALQVLISEGPSKSKFPII